MVNLELKKTESSNLPCIVFSLMYIFTGWKSMLLNLRHNHHSWTSESYSLENSFFFLMTFSDTLVFLPIFFTPYLGLRASTNLFFNISSPCDSWSFLFPLSWGIPDDKLSGYVCGKLSKCMSYHPSPTNILYNQKLNWLFTFIYKHIV